MRHWFHGTIEGHYVGRPSTPTEARLAAGGETFRIEIYRATISEVEIVAKIAENEHNAAMVSDDKAVGAKTDTSETASIAQDDQVKDGPNDGPLNERIHDVELPSFHHDIEGRVIHQSHIAQVHFLHALGPGRAVRGAARDVLIDRVAFSNPMRHEGKAYGRVEGRVSGWFRPPPLPLPPLEVEAPPAAAAVWESDLIDMPSAPHAVGQRETNPLLAGATNEATVAASDRRGEAPISMGVDVDAQELAGDEEKSIAPPSTEAASPRCASANKQPPADSLTTKEMPFVSIAAGFVLALLVVATPESAGLFAAAFLPAWLLRKWLIGVVPEASGVRIYAFLLNITVPLAALLMSSSWLRDGCKSMSALSLFVVVGGTLSASLLPRPLSLAICVVSLGFLLLGYYSQWGLAMC